MDGGAGGTGNEDEMLDDMDEGPGPGGGQKGRGVDSVDHDVGTPATGPSLATGALSGGVGPSSSKSAKTSHSSTAGKTKFSHIPIWQ